MEDQVKNELLEAPASKVKKTLLNLITKVGSCKYMLYKFTRLGQVVLVVAGRILM